MNYRFFKGSQKLFDAWCDGMDVVFAQFRHRSIAVNNFFQQFFGLGFCAWNSVDAYFFETTFFDFFEAKTNNSRYHGSFQIFYEISQKIATFVVWSSSYATDTRHCHIFFALGMTSQTAILKRKNNSWKCSMSNWNQPFLVTLLIFWFIMK